MSDEITHVGVKDQILPDIEVRYTDLSYSIMRVEAESKRQVPSVIKAMAATAFFPIVLPLRAIMARRAAAKAAAAEGVSTTSTKAKKTEFVILDKVSGSIRPGTLTLVLSPPGHGKSSFLKAITGRLPKGQLKGDISFSGVRPEVAAKEGVYLGQLVQYISQLDEHLPWLTVRETYSFVHSNACVDESMFGVSPELAGGVPNSKRVDDMVGMLGMGNCQNTVVGDALLRGISGGEKKRVTVGEGLLTNARILALDEPSTGLDSAVTFAIINSLRIRALRNGLAVVIALLQPTPECFNLFDDVVLMREGAVVYHGPRASIAEYFASLGYYPPAHGATPHYADMADWLVELVSDPTRALRKGIRAVAGAAAAGDGVTASDGVKLEDSPLVDVPITTTALVKAWRENELFKKQMSAPPAASHLSLRHPFSMAQYSASFSHPFFTHVGLLIRRQFVLMARNKLYIRSRVSASTFMAFILGGLYFQRSTAQALTFFGMFLNANMLMGFGNLGEMATVVESKFIAQKHVANGTFPSSGYVLAGMLAHLPVAVIETLVFTAVLYYMSGMAPSADRFFFFYLVVLLTNILFRNMMATFSYVGRSLQAAQAMPLPIISILIIFAGFLVTKDKMDWLEFVSYIDVFAYALRSMAQNEFFDSRYAIRPNGPSKPTVGEMYLKAFGINTEPGYQWGGIAFQCGCIAIVVACSFYAFNTLRFDRNIGSARQQPKEDDISGLLGNSSSSSSSSSGSNGNGPAVVVPMLLTPAQGGRAGNASGESFVVTNPNPVAKFSNTGAAPPSPPLGSNNGGGNGASSDASTILPFEPMTVAFNNILYTVNLPKHLGGGSKTLLQGISGYALPGRIIALMGASGAGKTTLLDVLGGRKNSGTMEGSIALNGHPKNTKTFNRVAAYVEQSDIHNPLTTVREALDFSASLRLPASVPTDARDAFVQQVLDLLELSEIAGRLVGQPNSQDGLAPGERKRLTIGVELVSNAPIIFLDEPTSGLDSRAAAIVMRVIRKIASTGRTVICTVHQPSAELFFAFDDLLLLQRGGWQVYFGPIGYHGEDMVRYLESVPGMARKPENMNPASWMLDALAGTDSSIVKGGSHLHKHTTPAAVIETAAAVAEGDAPLSPTSAAVAQGAAGSTVLLGEPLQTYLLQSALWKSQQGNLDLHMNPAPGSSPVNFPSLHARSFYFQCQVCLARMWATYSRNMGLNYGRFMALIVISLIFGIVYQGISDQAYDQSGVQSLTAAVFMSAAFSAMINMNVSVPSLLGGRAVFYREQASQMYHPSAFNVALFITELPWMAGIILATLPISYFLFGLNPAPGPFFFHYLATYVLCVVYISLGQFLAFVAPTFEAAQALLGVIGPLFFLWGGMWSPPSGMVPGARWFTWLDPVFYAFRALTPTQFWYDGPAGTGPTISVVTPGGLINMDRYQYFSERYEIVYEDRFVNVGYLAIFIIVFQCASLYATRYIRHIVR